MIPYKTYAVVGGDLRQAHIANRLAEQGNRVYALLLEQNGALLPELICSREPEEVLPECDVVIFPLPMTTDEQYINAPFSNRKIPVCDCFANLRGSAAAFAGKLSPMVRKCAARYGVHVTDYLEREELAVKNAVITAEAAVAIAMEELPISLFGSDCVVTGHGRISRALMRILRAMGARVTVSARQCGDLAEIEAEGCRAVAITGLGDCVSEADVVFNTVPARVLTRPVLAKLKPNALVIDLASKPGGTDLEAAADLRIKTIWALSLPGKAAPISAGEIILETIGNCLSERGVL